ncbi:MAG TPA: PQQ-dependent sugar dehydrogenase [Chthoniobacterales bacterium]|nr:PQQ-dependent sugar dehydrogenase [Chthoniobacterales bacterium]
MRMRAGKISLGLVCSIIVCSGTARRLHAQAVQGLDAIQVASGLSSPLFVTAPPGDFNRLFIVRQGGGVHILNLNTGVVNVTPFLTLSDIVVGGEEGLLGLAFDPDYATNGKFYVNCIAPGGAFNAGITQIRQYQVSSNPDIADTTPANVKIVLAFDQPQTNHNGGWIGFSPRAGDDHNLYIATGDGGNFDDQGPGHIEPGGNAQNNTTLLGKMLRIHVDPSTGTYTIPANNPFFGSATMRQEIWALGLRNPFRDSFDRSTGRMFIGDVGQSTREEVDVQHATNPGGGENYGWRDREGFVQNPAYATSTPTPTPNPPRVDPIFDYPRTTGRTVVGGYVYRGSRFPALQGIYVFGDYLGPTGGSARIFTLNYDGTTASNFQDITGQLFPIPTTIGNISLTNTSSFGEDAAGELYITDIGNGRVYKISPMLVSAASRKIHAITPFDLNLPLTGSPGIECRSGDYTMIFRFALPLSSVGGRSVTAGIGSVSSGMIDSSDAHNYVVNLVGVANAQIITVTLTSVTDVVTNTSSSVSATMGVLLGDVDGSGRVDSTDVFQVRQQSLQDTNASNFREDIDESGRVDSTDVFITRQQTLTSLPASAQNGRPFNSLGNRRTDGGLK